MTSEELREEVKKYKNKEKTVTTYINLTGY